MKKILISLSVIVAVGAIVAGATGAFFSDTETSTGNTFTAGAIDLKIDNRSYYNGVLQDGSDGTIANTTWLVAKDLKEGEDFFFNFSDLKPGDWGEDTISIHINNNDAYACVDVRLDSDDDNGLTEPESAVDSTDGAGNGELADAIDFFWWVDDGDNVFESDETLIPAGPLGNLSVGEVATIALAEPGNGGIFGGALTGGQTYFIGKAWCFGTSRFLAYPDVNISGVNIDTSPIERPVTCNGSGEGNETQTDSMTATISFYVEQARNNDGFSCVSHLTTGF